MDTVDPSGSGLVFYARIWPRVKAMLIDWFLLMGAFFAAAVIGANIPGTGAVTFGLWAVLWVLYDPLMVWRTGATLGHRAQNLRVVSDRTGANPSFLAALIRSLGKGLFGIISLLAMAGSARHKTLHDWIARTTVQPRDPSLARSRDFKRMPRPAPLQGH